jgi:hypothetical protein
LESEKHTAASVAADLRRIADRIGNGEATSFTLIAFGKGMRPYAKVAISARDSLSVCDDMIGALDEAEEATRLLKRRKAEEAET